MALELDETIVEDVADDSAEEVIPEYSIMSYGADFTVDSLVRRLRQDDIFIPPFQREFVWNQKMASRFVESLLLGLPVPGIFLSEEEETKRLIVVDGQQRLKSLHYFYEGNFAAKKFVLSGIDSRFKGQTYDSLNAADRRTLDNSILHATIFRQDVPSDDSSSVYQVFERLNTGGRQLFPQEIRAAMYHGPFNDLLQELNGNSTWRELFGKVDKRMKDRELILRFLAMHFNRADYKSPWKRFLNTYMAGNRNLQRQSKGEIKRVFENAMETVYAHLGSHAFKSDKNRFAAAVFDSVAVGIAHRLERGDIQNGKMLKAQYESLMKNENYRKVIYGGTAHTKVVNTRLDLAIDAFSNVP